MEIKPSSMKRKPIEMGHWRTHSNVHPGGVIVKIEDCYPKGCWIDFWIDVATLSLKKAFLFRGILYLKYCDGLDLKVFRKVHNPPKYYLTVFGIDNGDN
jgi:hypothetical protein